MTNTAAVVVFGKPHDMSNVFWRPHKKDGITALACNAAHTLTTIDNALELIWAWNGMFVYFVEGYNVGSANLNWESRTIQISSQFSVDKFDLREQHVGNLGMAKKL